MRSSHCLTPHPHPQSTQPATSPGLLTHKFFHLRTKSFARKDMTIFGKPSGAAKEAQKSDMVHTTDTLLRERTKSAQAEWRLATPSGMSEESSVMMPGDDAQLAADLQELLVIESSSSSGGGGSGSPSSPEESTCPMVPLPIVHSRYSVIQRASAPPVPVGIASSLPSETAFLRVPQSPDEPSAAVWAHAIAPTGSESYLASARRRSIRAAWETTLERTIKSIISIEATRVRSFDTDKTGAFHATGFVVDKQRGIILSNRHVVSAGPITAKVSPPPLPPPVVWSYRLVFIV